MISIFSNPFELGRALAEEIVSAIEAAARAKRPFLLGCPGGRSLQTTYQALGGLAQARRADLSRLIIVMMDEYLQPSERGFDYCPADAHYSCRKFAVDDIWRILNQHLSARTRSSLQNIWTPDPADPAAFDERLSAAGGIDLFLLASGASDGHVAFNPPGSGLHSTTRIIALAEETRRDNLDTFPLFNDLSEVPTHGVSVGLGTIVEQSKQAVMVIHGAHKQQAARRLLALSRFDPAWPASIVYACKQGRIFVDEAAAAGCREQKPEQS